VAVAGCRIRSLRKPLIELGNISPQEGLLKHFGFSVNYTGGTDLESCQTVANWYRLFSDERFRNLSPQAYRDHNFIREHCRLGFEHFVQNSVDEALLQLYSNAVATRNIAIIGAPFTPCHWGTLAVLVHLFGGGNFDLTAKRCLFWLTTEPGERALFSRLRMHQRFRRIAEAIDFVSSVEHYNGRCDRTTLILLRGLHELPAVPRGASIIVSDPRGELVFRKGEAEDLVRSLRSITTFASLIIPSRNITFRIAPDAVCWPWSEAALGRMQVRSQATSDALPWKWEAGAHFAGQAERRVLAVTGTTSAEELLVELKRISYGLFSKPKTFYDTRLMIEFQRINGAFRQLAIPFDEHERGDDDRRLSARLTRLESDTDRATGDISDELQIGLLYIGDLIRKLQATNGKWDAFRRCIDECVEQQRDLGLAFPQLDPYSAERTKAYAKTYARSKGASLNAQVIASPDELPEFSGNVVLVGVPKLAHASRWRIPFRGQLTLITWQFDQQLASIAMRESNSSSESVRRRTWLRDFRTPLGAHDEAQTTLIEVEELSERSGSEEVNGEIEAFDPSYRGNSARSESIVADTIKAKAEFCLTFDDGSTMPTMAGEEHHVLITSFASTIVKPRSTAMLREGDDLVLVNGASYGQLTKRLQLEADRASSLLSFNELWERWQMLCLEQDDSVATRELFIHKLTNEYGCSRGRATILSWLRLQRMGPEKYEDIACAALAAGDFELARNANQLWRGLDQRRTRHRLLGKWLMKALARSAATDPVQSNKVIDQNLGLTFGDLQTGISVRRIRHIQVPRESSVNE
jgi:hypothetical protein